MIPTGMDLERLKVLYNLGEATHQEWHEAMVGRLGGHTDLEAWLKLKDIRASLVLEKKSYRVSDELDAHFSSGEKLICVIVPPKKVDVFAKPTGSYFQKMSELHSEKDLRDINYGQGASEAERFRGNLKK